MTKEWKTPYSSTYPKATVIFFLFAFVGCFALLNNTKSRPLLKFCFNSRDQFVAAQCVLCDFYQFSATVLGCNGRTSALLSNITSTEAVCIISNCLQQVRQAQPQFTGRRKRDEPTPVPSIEHLIDVDEKEILDEKEEMAAASTSMKELFQQYVMLDETQMKELEEQVVDRVEVNVDAQDYEYE
ncbi:uncharacterized protein LOC129219123 [Uloborus diversus]|uniref:uncharacterized protein LOC129219123 n=1 Tax=Uloborus diversus TaxID=327109 RepID=UPI00240A7191|nr:uncharacterized protein LOC129219123 [Uloborus diversus]